MTTLERLLIRIGALRDRWRARRFALARRWSIEPADIQSANDVPERIIDTGNSGAAGATRTRASPKRRRTWGRILVATMWLAGWGTFLFVAAMTSISLREPPQKPRFPNATLCVSQASRGGEFARIRLQGAPRPQVLIPGAFEIVAIPNLMKFKDNDKGITLQVEWRFLHSTSAGDSYDFKITAPSGIQSVQNSEVTAYPTELLRDGDLVITTRCP